MQRATGPRLLGDRPWPALGSNPRPRGRWSSTLTTRLSRHPTGHRVAERSHSHATVVVHVQCTCLHSFHSLNVGGWFLKHLDVTLLTLKRSMKLRRYTCWSKGSSLSPKTYTEDVDRFHLNASHFPPQHYSAIIMMPIQQYCRTV